MALSRRTESQKRALRVRPGVEVPTTAWAAGAAPPVVMMLLLLSPAKTINLGASVAGAPRLGAPRFLSPAAGAPAAPVLSAARALGEEQLKSLMGISAPLAKLNRERYVGWDDLEEIPAAAAFDGPAFKKLAAGEMDAAQLKSCQARVRILSGLYGLLKPLDAVRPYRLEMGTKLAIGDSPNLQAYWRPHIALALNEELAAAGKKKNAPGKILVNAASQEYFAAVDAEALDPDVTLLTVEFPGPAVYAKQARGAICKYATVNECETAEDLKGFTGEEGEWTFAGEVRVSAPSTPFHPCLLRAWRGVRACSRVPQARLTPSPPFVPSPPCIRTCAHVPPRMW